MEWKGGRKMFSERSFPSMPHLAPSSSLLFCLLTCSPLPPLHSYVLLQGVDILVATPGRMLAHLTETNGVVALCGGVKVLILDEADRLLDMGFKR